MDETEYRPPEQVPPPPNVMVYSPLNPTREYHVRWDRLPDLRVLGYGVYRAYTEQGEYVRLTDTVIQDLNFRDSNADSFQEIEKLNQSYTNRPGWYIAEDGNYVLRTKNQPIVKAGGFSEISQNPEDAIVEIDGKRIYPTILRGDAAEIILNKDTYYDPMRQVFVEPTLPNQLSDVRVSYWYRKNFIDVHLTRHHSPWYKVTTVAYDEAKGVIIETNPALVKPIKLLIEQRDWIWEEAIRRNTWIAEMAAERMLLFQQKKAGVLCACICKDEGTYYPVQDCKACYGTGFVGGFEPPTPMMITIPFSEKEFKLEDRGVRATQAFSNMWSPPLPLVEQYDLLLRQNGELLMAGPVRRPNHRGHLNLQQRFSADFLNFNHVQYEILKTLGQFRTLTTLEENPAQGPTGSRVQLLAEKSPEPILYFKGRTVRFPTIMY